MKTDDTTVLLASRDTTLVMRFTRILAVTGTVTRAGTWPEAIRDASTTPHDLAILDPGLANRGAIEAVTEFSAACPDTRIIVVDNPPLSETEQVALFKVGVHGFCQRQISPELLRKAIGTVVNGELWMQRSLVTRILENLTQGSTTGELLPGDTAIKCLTPRELEVARMVHEGGNNKSIARELDISERTVKAHLSSIFRKLHVDNRLHLALFFHKGGS